MKYLKTKLAQFKQWILSIVIGRFYTQREVVALFEKFESDRGQYYAEDAADILPLEVWLKENKLMD